ncbi:MAG: hypothetical protein IAE97_12330 [Chthoniobacterales bacterium]|nr:hypothetical protein [Chthoniobacterales bacterium]
MKPTYLVLRTLGVAAAAWILLGLVSGYMQMHEQMSGFLPGSIAQEANPWGFFFAGAIPCAILVVVLLLPYGRLSTSVRMACIAVLCLAVGFVGWSFLRPFTTISGFHWHAMPMATWLALTGYLAVVGSQITAIILARKWSNGAPKPAPEVGPAGAGPADPTARGKMGHDTS